MTQTVTHEDIVTFGGHCECLGDYNTLLQQINKRCALRKALVITEVHESSDSPECRFTIGFTHYDRLLAHLSACFTGRADLDAIRDSIKVC